MGPVAVPFALTRRTHGLDEPDSIFHIHDRWPFRELLDKFIDEKRCLG